MQYLFRIKDTSDPGNTNEWYLEADNDTDANLIGQGLAFENDWCRSDTTQTLLVADTSKRPRRWNLVLEVENT